MALPKVLDKKILVRQVEDNKEKIIITLELDKRNEYIVEAIGKNVQDVKVNDIVYIGNYGYQEIKYKKISYFVFEESQVLAILPKEE